MRSWETHESFNTRSARLSYPQSFRCATASSVPITVSSMSNWVIERTEIRNRVCSYGLNFQTCYPRGLKNDADGWRPVYPHWLE